MAGISASAIGEQIVQPLFPIVWEAFEDYRMGGMFLSRLDQGVIANDLLQARFVDAGKTLGRFLLNSTVGLAGIWDVAIEAGWERHDSDFGQTLGTYGAQEGFYLVLPILGPSSLRDGAGGFVDIFLDPLTADLEFESVSSTDSETTGITLIEVDFDTNDTTDVTAGEIVLVLGFEFTGTGDIGSRYLFVGGTDLVDADLSMEDYSDTNDWMKIGGTVGSVAWNLT